MEREDLETRLAEGRDLNTIRGIVETRQSQRDRTFQKYVGIGGISLGSASITASALSSFIPEDIEEWQPVAIVFQHIPDPWVNRPTIALSLSVITGLIPIAIYCFYAILNGLFYLRKKE